MTSRASTAPQRVAFLIDAGAYVIDFAGPWEAFQDARVQGDPRFVLYTVAPTRDPIRVSGVGLHLGPDYEVVQEKGGFETVPDFDFETAPEPDILVFGAQTNHSEEKLEWIRATAARAHPILSVCTGAFLLAKTGLLDGQSATTHHRYYERFARAFPSVKLERDRRFVDNGQLVTSGGLTSGLDGALHVIARTEGARVARRTALEMEYGW